MLRDILWITLFFMFVTVPHVAWAGRLVHHLDAAFQGADGGLIHGFDCLDGPDVCGGLATEDQRHAGAPLFVYFSIQGRMVQLRFLSADLPLVVRDGGVTITIPLDDRLTTQRTFTLYEGDANAQDNGVQPLVITRSVTPFDQVTISIRTGETE